MSEKETTAELIEKIGEALRDECLTIYGTNWNNDVAWQFARRTLLTIQDMGYVLIKPETMEKVLVEIFATRKINP